jgi:N-acyl-D-aspartate/D-glutamate deacylase
MHELVIRGGTVVDGTGADGRRADVAVDDGRIVAVEAPGRAGAGRRELDADGLLVLPGWVDIHTHYDGQATWDPMLQPSSFHGVTTTVFGNCGVGFAPVRPGSEGFLINLMEGVEDIPGTALAEGIDFRWEHFEQYLDALDAGTYAMDIGTQVPHGALRFYVMGERGADHAEVPTADEVAEMGMAVRAALDAGASASPPAARPSTGPRTAGRRRRCRPGTPSWSASPTPWAPPARA